MKLPLRNHPLWLPIAAALMLRMAAATFGGGYLTQSEQFDVLEVAGAWADEAMDHHGLSTENEYAATSHSPNLAYTGSQYLCIRMCQCMGLESPAMQALALRLLHGFYSLSLVVLGYLLTRVLAPVSRKAALTTAWILAAGSFWPLLSVHQLVEVACVPPLMLTFWSMARHKHPTTRDLILAGAGLGIAVGLNYLCGLVAMVLVPVLLAQRQIRALPTLGVSSLVAFAVLQTANLVVWEAPLVPSLSEVAHHLNPGGQDELSPGYARTIILLTLLIPPVSLMLLWCSFQKGNPSQQRLRVSVPLYSFFFFCCFSANRPTLLCLTAIPGLIALGSADWHTWSMQSNWWRRHRKLERGIWTIFWMLSSGLLTSTLSYTGNKTRVDAMKFLQEQGSPVFAWVQVDNGGAPPTFYSGSQPEFHVDDRTAQLNDPLEVSMRWCGYSPAFVFFQGDRHLGEAVAEYKGAMPGLRYVTTFKPNRIDRWLHEWNSDFPVERIMVYATADALPCP